MNKPLKSFKFRLIALCMIALITVIAVIHTAVYTTTRTAIEEQIEMGAKGAAISIASTLMENVEEYIEFLETRDVDSEYYQRMRAYFAGIKDGSNIKYIYTEQRINAETIEFILDAEPIENDDYSPPGSTTPNDEYREQAYSTAEPVGFRLVRYSEWGQLLGAYAPIFDRDGELIGIIGVNIDGANLYSHLNRLQMTMLAIYVFIIGLALLVLLKYSNTLLEPMLKDKLTGAFNMRFFENFIQEEIQSAAKNHSELTLMMLDLDHFKKVNDTYGHGFGDTVLTTVSETIMKCLRKTDYFFRYGGEEFLVMITKTDIEQVLEIAERIRTAIEKNEIFNKELNIPVKITISIGVAHLDTKGGIGTDNLFENADKALYHAKITRNTVSLFDNIGETDFAPKGNS